MIQKLKTYMMPIAMAIGGLFYEYFEPLSFCTPWLIAIMLFISYSKISLKDIKVTQLHLMLLLIQVVGSIVLLLAMISFDKVMAQGAMICILAPTATSAVVITGMLGGNTGSLTTYSLLSNTAVTLIAPVMFTIIGENADMTFSESAFSIFQRVFLLLLLPFILALLIKRYLPKIHKIVNKSQIVSFYLWTLALAVVTARTISFVISQGKSHYFEELVIALIALVVCLTQFFTGRVLGKKYNDTIAGGQGLGQKNTILAIWMSQTYLDPLSSIAPGAYVLWQNIVNSYQVWLKRKDL